MSKVYLVIRSSGQYEDYRTVAIAAYLDKRLAETHSKLATDALPALRDRNERWHDKMFGEGSDPNTYKGFHGGTKFDRGAGDGYDTSYYVESLPVLDRVRGTK